jgi:hypothetical protein
MNDLELALHVLDRIGMKRDSYEELCESAFEVAYKGDGDWMEAIPKSNHHKIPDDYKILLCPLVVKDYFEKYKLECTLYIFFEQERPDKPFTVIITDEEGLTIKFADLYY